MIIIIIIHNKRIFDGDSVYGMRFVLYAMIANTTNERERHHKFSTTSEKRLFCFFMRVRLLFTYSLNEANWNACLSNSVHQQQNKTKQNKKPKKRKKNMYKYVWFRVSIRWLGANNNASLYAFFRIYLKNDCVLLLLLLFLFLLLLRWGWVCFYFWLRKVPTHVCVLLIGYCSTVFFL